MTSSEENWKKVHAVKEKHCSSLLQNPHVNYVGVSLKQVAGKCTGVPAIVVAVKRKMSASELKEGERIAPLLDGVPTDVIEGDLNLVKI